MKISSFKLQEIQIVKTMAQALHSLSKFKGKEIRGVKEVKEDRANSNRTRNKEVFSLTKMMSLVLPQECTYLFSTMTAVTAKEETIVLNIMMARMTTIRGMDLNTAIQAINVLERMQTMDQMVHLKAI